VASDPRSESDTEDVPDRGRPRRHCRVPRGTSRSRPVQVVRLFSFRVWTRHRAACECLLGVTLTRGKIPNCDEPSNRCSGYVREPPSTAQKDRVHRRNRRRRPRRSIRIAGRRRFEAAEVATVQGNRASPSSAGGHLWHHRGPRQLHRTHLKGPLADDRPAGDASRGRHDRCRHGPSTR
jgi:hypothetical protein